MNMFSKPILLAFALGIVLTGNARGQNATVSEEQRQLHATRVAERRADMTGEYYKSPAEIQIEQREMRRPVIGVLLAGDDKPGVRIVGVTPDGAAAEAGVKGGDRIIRINDKAIDAVSGEARVAQARAMLAMSADAKTPVNLAYERDGKTVTATMTPKVGNRLFILSDVMSDAKYAESKAHFDASTASRTSSDSVLASAVAKRRAAQATMIAPEVHREIMRIDSDCKGNDCKMPALVEALRWSGVNLATVDAGLGRYFGTDRGVLVLGTGKDLAGLQVGDVIRTIDGKAVNTPREAMDALRAQPADSKVTVDYLRDRKEASVQVTVPKATAPFRITMPSNASHVVEKRRYVMKDKDGKTQTWEGGPNDTPPSWVKDAGKDGQRIERRKTVIVQDGPDGATPASPKVD